MKIGIILASIISVGLAQSHFADHLNEVYKIMDINGDGELSLPEFQTKFDTVDLNHDGHVTLEEFIKGTHSTDRARTTELYKFYDTDHDGDLSRDVDIKLFIASVDTNGDGMLNKHEFSAFYLKLYSMNQHHI